MNEMASKDIYISVNTAVNRFSNNQNGAIRSPRIGLRCLNEFQKDSMRRGYYLGISARIVFYSWHKL